MMDPDLADLLDFLVDHMTLGGEQPTHAQVIELAVQELYLDYTLQASQCEGTRH